MDQLGKYQLVEKIGIGGFGEVFKGYDPLIKRYVAIKTCAVKTDDVRARFFQEAEIAGNLHHRNITTVYDFGVEDDLPYLVQEYLSGEDLDRKIKRRDALSVAEKIGILVQIARGLAFAHANTVIHRDIKPANIRILEDGTAKIMDFGIAKLAQQESGLTQTGMTIGTAAYLSPEQVRGAALDVRTDIFSFGVLSYELLAYKRPFEGRDLSAVTYQVAHAEPTPLAEAAPSTPAQLIKIVQRCMQKPATLRFADGGELARELERLQAQLAGKIGNFGDNLTLPIQKSKPLTAGNFDTTVKAAAEDLPTPAPNSLPPPTPRGTTGPPRRPDLPLHGGGPTSQPIDPSLRTRRDRLGMSDLELQTGAQAASLTGMSAGPKASAWPLPLPWLIIIGLLAFSALLIGLLLGRGSSPSPATTATTSTANSTPGEREPARPNTAPPKAQPPAPTPTTTSPATTRPSATTPATTTPATSASTTTPSTTASTTTAAPDVPEPAADGTVVVRRPSWTEAMVVILGKKAYRLDQDRRLILAPGQYSLTFQIDESGYRVSTSTRVTVISGKESSLSPPIPQPGQLSVRALPGGAQGEVLVDGQSQGGSPLTRLRLAPGSHQLEIRGKDATRSPIRQTLTVEAGRETIVTFNLAQNSAQIVVK